MEDKKALTRSAPGRITTMDIFSTFRNKLGLFDNNRSGKGHDRRLARIASVGKLQCLDHKRLFPIRRSAGRVVLGVIRMSHRSQIEGPKFGRLRNKRLFTCTDQCEYHFFHIFCSSLLHFFRLTLSVVWPLSDNYYFLYPITKADVWLGDFQPAMSWPLLPAYDFCGLGA